MAGEELKKRLLFPFERIRNIQKDMLLAVESCLKKKEHLITHAPTGMGKTIATIGPALRYAKDNKKTVFFLTSRHTQHLIALETLKLISEKFGESIKAVDIIGKKWMCLQPGIERLFSSEFADYCKRLVEEDKCDFYSKLKYSSKLTTDAKLIIEKLQGVGAPSTEDVIRECKEKKICPYYLSMELAPGAEVVIADYYYMFNPVIRENFLRRAKKEIGDAIIIVDEGHNLGERIRDLSTVRLSSEMIKRAVKEAKKTGFEQHIPNLVQIQDFLNVQASKLKDTDEGYVDKAQFIKTIGKDYEQMITDFYAAAEDVREQRKISYLGSIASFLEVWPGDDKGFTRIISQKSDAVVLSYRCLDPGIITGPVISQSHSTIIMSGTLTPNSMYHDLLGFPKNTVEKTYPSPFKQQNRLNIIVPETTTKYTARSPKQYNRIAEICAEATNAVPGNSAIFFPSYAIRDAVERFFDKYTRKTTIKERPGLTKEEKVKLLGKFKKHSKSGAVLLGVAGGSFGEGIDLPGDYLKAVIVVGLPLQRPDLETKALIDYYDRKFGKGWDYGYIFPAFNRAIQSAGRCIRSDTDRGVVIFLDERYVWRNYFAMFPLEWEFTTTREPVPAINDFFK